MQIAHFHFPFTGVQSSIVFSVYHRMFLLAFVGFQSCLPKQCDNMNTGTWKSMSEMWNRFWNVTWILKCGMDFQWGLWQPHHSNSVISISSSKLKPFLSTKMYSCNAPVNVMPLGGGGQPRAIWWEIFPLGGDFWEHSLPLPRAKSDNLIRNGRKTSSVTWGFWHDVISLGLGIWCDNFFMSESPGSAPRPLPGASHWYAHKHLPWLGTCHCWALSTIYLTSLYIW